MIIDLGNGRKELEIFRTFIVDRCLPKYQNNGNLRDVEINGRTFTQSNLSSDVSGFASQSAMSVMVSNSGATNPSMFISSGSFQTSANGLSRNPTLLERIAELFKRKPPKPVSVEKVFEMIMNNQESLTEFKTRIKNYEQAIINARTAGQTALVEQLVAAKPMKMFEDQLYVNGFRKYISEQNLILACDKVEKGLRLDWIKNFIRPLPTAALEQKIKMDSYNIFDNYVVLHYDPTGAATKLTKAEEIEKAKDPILFGVMLNSRSLYFIADWKDDICTLTFEDIVAAIGEDKTQLK